MIKLIDDLLTYQEWQELHDYFLDCNWVYHQHIVGEDEKVDHFQFVHFVQVATPFPTPIDNKPLSTIQPVLKKLNIDFLLRAKVNLSTRTHEAIQTDFHCDTEQNNLTAIYYLNTCNGKTRFENPDIGDVDSVANRLLIFNSHQKHCTVTATDVKARVVININYLPIRKRSNGL